MAKAEADDITNCAICLQPYSDTGEQVPRILPCHHTYCEKCTKQWLETKGGKELVCPECRETHPATTGVRSFPQNKFILSHIKRSRRESRRQSRKSQGTGKESFDECDDHEKEASFYCKSVTCRKAICPLCLLEAHRSHDVVDLSEERSLIQETFLANLETAGTDLRACKDKLLAGKEAIGKKNRACIFEAGTRKIELTRRINQNFEKIIQEINKNMRETDKAIDDEISTVDEFLDMLDNMRINPNETLAHSEWKDRLQTVKTIKQNIDEYLTPRKKYKFFQYRKNENIEREVPKLCGDITASELEINMDKTEVLPSVSRKETASLFTCKADQSVDLETETLGCMSLLDEKRILIASEEDGKWELKEIKLEENGGEVWIKTLKDQPQGMSEITLAGRNCLAVSYQIKNKILPNRLKIDFHHSDNLDTVIRSHSVTPYLPGHLNRSSSSMLLYEDMSKYPRDVRWLDCSTNSPKPAQGTSITQTQIKTITDMCFVEHGNKELLVMAGDNEELVAYNMASNKPEWKAKGHVAGMTEKINPWGVTTDDSGHLYVSDVNNGCVQMFTTYGKYMGALLREGEQGLGNPSYIRWCNSKSSLIIAHTKGMKWSVSSFYVE